MCVVTQRECKPHNWDYLGIHREYTPLKGVRDLNTSGYPIPRQCLIHPVPLSGSATGISNRRSFFTKSVAHHSQHRR